MEGTTLLKMEEALNSYTLLLLMMTDNKRFIRQMRVPLRDQECGQFKVRLF
jgi:hypothetical protein